MKTTRSRQSVTLKADASAKESNKDKTDSSASKLEKSTEIPPLVFVLPQNLSPSARIISARVSRKSEKDDARRYLVCPHNGFYEFTKVAEPKTECSSWLLAPAVPTCETSKLSTGAGNYDTARSAAQAAAVDTADVLKSPELLVATPLDPLFFLLTSRDVLWPNSVMGNAEYLSMDTRLGMLRSQHEHLDQLMRDDTRNNLDERLQERIKDVCDVEIIPGEDSEPTYSLSLTKLYGEFVRAARRVVRQGMPSSMEERFVKGPLQVPELIVAREDSGISLADDASQPQTAPSDRAPNPDSQHNDAVAGATASREASEEVRHLLRIRTVVQYLMKAYLPWELCEAVRKQLHEPKSSAYSKVGINFTALDEHLARVDALKKEAQALRSLSDNISRKRGGIDDDEALEKADAKRRKKEDDGMKKKNIGRGVKQLAKADTSGMKKLSAFFTKAPAKKAA